MALMLVPVLLAPGIALTSVTGRTSAEPASKPTPSKTKEEDVVIEDVTDDQLI